MAELYLDDVAVLSGTITLPVTGRWSASLVLDTDAKTSGAVTLTDGADLSLVGTVRWGGGYAERGHVEVVGGAYALHQELPPLYYRAAPARVVLRDLLRDALHPTTGRREALDETGSDPAIDRTLLTWTRRRGPAAEALEAVCEALALDWRVLPDGKVRVGTPAWTELALAADRYDVVDDQPAQERLVIGSDTILADLLPGVTFRGRQVVEVRHEVTGDRLRTVVTSDPEGLAPGYAEARRAARAYTRHLEYLRLAPAEVVAQDGTTGALDVIVEPDTQPDKRRWPPLTAVPLRTLAPGVAVRVAAGARVLVGWEGGDAEKPYAAGFDPGVGDLSSLKLGATASEYVALAQKVDTALADFRTWANAHVHTGVTTGGGSSGPPGTPLGSAASVAAAKVKAE